MKSRTLYSNTKFWKLNSFSRAVPVMFPVMFFETCKEYSFGTAVVFWPSINAIMKSWCDDVGEGTFLASGWISTLSTQQFHLFVI